MRREIIMTRAGDDDDSDAAAFWRDRAARIRAIAHSGSSGARADDDGDARGNHLGLVALRADVADAHRRARAATSTSWMPMEYPSSEERDARAMRAQLAEAVTVCLERAKARRAARAAQPTTTKPTRTLMPENALDDAATVDGLREGYKRLLREVTARHTRTREALEEEIATLRARVEALETSSKKNERTTPTKERLIALAYDDIDGDNNGDDADDDIACELSPFSASERTPPLRLREDADEENADEEDADVETPRAFRPPRPPKNGNENDRTFDANIAPPPLPAVRPGQGYVCPFSGKVLLKTP